MAPLTLMELGIFALVAGLLFRFPHIGMLVHPDGKHPHKKRAWIAFFRQRFNRTAQSFIAVGAGLFTLGFFTFGLI